MQAENVSQETGVSETSTTTAPSSEKKTKKKRSDKGPGHRKFMERLKTRNLDSREVIQLQPENYPESRRASGNPKRPGSQVAKRFSRYKNGMTVAQARGAGITPADLVWDEMHGFIKLTKPASKTKKAA